MKNVYFESPIGLIKIIGNDTYISAIEFVQDQKQNLHELNNNSLLQDCVYQLDEYFAGKRKMFDLPIKQEGTAFQQAVWKELQEIPYGETVSYLGLAKKLENEKAVRAVGAANGKNKIPIIIPCHRVIGSNGKLVGFAYGIERKKYLLELEKPQVQLIAF